MLKPSRYIVSEKNRNGELLLMSILHCTYVKFPQAYADEVLTLSLIHIFIGGKSTGKSILLHNLANSIDSTQVREKEDKSSSTTKNIENVSVTWKDGKKDEARKIVYIPQTYLNRLSEDVYKRQA